MDTTPLEQIIEWAGSQTALANMLGVTRGAVSQWRDSGIPANRAVQIERLTAGKFKAAKIARPLPERAA